MKYLSVRELLSKAKEQKMKVSQLIIEDQANLLCVSADDVYSKMEKAYNVMKSSVESGFKNKNTLKIEQEDGAKIYKKYVEDGKSIFNDRVGTSIAMAMAVAEVNASMGKIVAAPTAGSCGILPGAILGIKEAYKLSDEDAIHGLFTASGIGMVMANIFNIAGATGGCQAECGSAQAMAAGAIVEMMGGDYEKIENAIAIAIQNIEGLVCDPVAGLVECPCIKRNASGVLNAILAADLALAGVKSIIPADETILSMKQIGDIMDDRLKETALGGLAVTETGKELRKKIFN